LKPLNVITVLMLSATSSNHFSKVPFSKDHKKAFSYCYDFG